MLSPPRVTKQTILDLVTLALDQTPLREMGIDAIRSVLGANPRIAVLDGAFDLEPVWELLASQEGFDAESARPPFALVKTLEPRLGVAVRLPHMLAELTPAELVRYASMCPVKREDIDRVLAAPTIEKVATSGVRPPPSTIPPRNAPQAPAAWPGAPKPGRRKTTLAVAGALALASLVWVGWYVVSHAASSPDWSTVATSDLGDLPIASARRWREEVRATLSDNAWLGRPEETRRADMQAALRRLTSSGVSTLIVMDGQERIRASAQVARAGAVVKFY